MPHPPFSAEAYYHVYNRGSLKQPIFFDDEDRIRFVQCLNEFNNLHNTRGFQKNTHARYPVITQEPLVSLLAWCLMPNHFHLLLTQKLEGGISLFMKKLGGGYTKYINKKYERSGHLFQGRYCARLIASDPYFMHISRYIHLNPVALVEPGWEDLGVKNLHTVETFLEIYPWSSHNDWMEKPRFPSILDQNLARSLRGSVSFYKKFLRSWLTSGRPTS